MYIISWSTLERGAIDGNGPVNENYIRSEYLYLSTTRARKLCGKQAILLAKAKYSISPIVHKYREGKVKSREVIPVK